MEINLKKDIILNNSLIFVTDISYIVFNGITVIISLMSLNVLEKKKKKKKK